MSEHEDRIKAVLDLLPAGETRTTKQVVEMLSEHPEAQKLYFKVLKKLSTRLQGNYCTKGPPEKNFRGVILHRWQWHAGRHQVCNFCAGRGYYERESDNE